MEQQNHLDALFRSHEHLKRRLKTCQENLSEQRDFGDRLEERRRKAIDQMVDSSASRAVAIGYSLFYLVLLSAAISIYVLNFRLIFPEQTLMTGILSSLVIAGPSYLFAREYQHRSLDRREKLGRFLNWLGISSCVLMLVCFALSRFLIYHLLSSSSSISVQSLFNSNSKLDFLSAAQAFSSAVAFFASTLAEIGLTSALAIYISKQFERHKPIELLTTAISETEKKCRDLELEEEKLTELIERANGDDASLQAWADKKKRALCLQLESLLARAREEIYQKVGMLPVSELQSIVGRRGNGRPQLKGELKNVTTTHDRLASSKYLDSDGI